MPYVTPFLSLWHVDANVTQTFSRYSSTSVCSWLNHEMHWFTFYVLHVRWYCVFLLCSLHINLYCLWQTRFLFKHYHLCLCSVQSDQWLLWRQPVQSYARYLLYSLFSLHEWYFLSVVKYEMLYEHCQLSDISWSCRQVVEVIRTWRLEIVVWCLWWVVERVSSQ